MASESFEYSPIDFDWYPSTRWMLPPEHADKLLAKWVRQVPKRVEKLLRLLGSEGVINSPNAFTSDELPKLERFVLGQCSLEQSAEDKKYYLDGFSFEISKDIAALIGQICQQNRPELVWSLLREPTDAAVHNTIGMVSSYDGAFVPIPDLVADFAQEGLRNKRSLLGRFQKPREGFLTRLVVMTSAPPENG